MALDWKVISQRNWVKGLQATFSRFAQPQGIVTRLSNLLYDQRGGNRTTDGSFTFSTQGGASSTQGKILELALYSPTGQVPYYIDSQSTILAGTLVYPVITVAGKTVGGTIATVTQAGTVVTVTFTAPHNLVPNGEANGLLVQAGISNPVFNGNVPFSNVVVTGPTTYTYMKHPIATLSATGGTVTTTFTPLATSTYYVTALDGRGGETPTPNNATLALTGSQNAVLITWTPVASAVYYNIYGRAFPTGQTLNAAPVNATSFIDLGGPLTGPVMPSFNTSQNVLIQSLQPPTGSTVLGTFPTYFAPPLGGIPGTLSVATNPTSGLANPNGGVIGATGPLPQFVEFANKMIFAMGNGYAPQEYLDNGSGGTTGALTPVGNTFNSQYPDWQPSVDWNQGAIIKDSVSGGVFTAIQAGTSGATRPAFVDTLQAITPDTAPGTVVWQNTAVSALGTPLRGAAHAIVYAGSLWIANTWPVTTTDLLDGPNCIKMSDSNNPESWNPVNTAFLSKDDGDQITGLATYTIAEAGISPTGSLVVFKFFSTFQITGVFGATDLTIQQAQTDMGNIAPRSAEFMPGFGIMRLTHLGFAYFNGVNDKLASEEVRPYIFGGKTDIQALDWNYVYFSKGTQAANPPMYVCACPIVPITLNGVTFGGPTAGSPLYPLYVRVIQLTLSAWGNWEESATTPETTVYYTAVPQVVVTTPSAVAGIKYRVFVGAAQNTENQYLEGASFAGTYLLSTFLPGNTSYGVGGLQRIFCFDMVAKSWAIIDLPMQISMLKQIRSPGTVPLTVAGGAEDGQVRRLFSGDLTWDNGDEVQWSFRSGELFQQGGSAKVFYRRLVIRGSGNIGGSVSVTLNLQGAGQPTSTYPTFQLGGNQWELRVDINKDAANANAQLSGTGPAQVVIESMDWYVKPKASGAPTTIQK